MNMGASVPYPSFFTSRQSIKPALSTSRGCKFKVKASSSYSEPDPVKFAFAKARAYQKAVRSNNPTPLITPNPVPLSSENRMKNDETISVFPDGDFSEVEAIVETASTFGKAAASKPNTTLKKDSGRYKPKITSWVNRPSTSNTSETDGPRAMDLSPEGGFPEVEIIIGDASKFGKARASKPTTTLQENPGLHKPKVSLEPKPLDNDPVKLAFAKARAYQKADQSNKLTPKISPNSGRESSENQMKDDGLVLEYTNGDTPLFADLMKQMAKQYRDNNIGDETSDGDFPEVELIVGDASKFGKAAASKPVTTLKEDSGRYKPKITSWGNPPSPSNTSDTDGPRATNRFPEGLFPEVENIAGDASKFGKATASKPTTLKEDSGLQKPKVSLELESVDNDPLKLAFAKASAYKKDVQSNIPTPKISPNSGRESSENWMKNDGSILRSTNEDTALFADLLKQTAKQNRDNNSEDTISGGDFPEVELIVGDPSKFGKAAASKPNTTLKKDSGQYKPKISSWGNLPSASNALETDGSRATEPFSEGDFPEVEIIVGDASKFRKVAASKPTTTLKEDSGLQKPKVSSEPEPVDNDPLKLAFARASAYKKAVQSNISTPKISLNSGRESSENWMKNDGSVLESTNEDTPPFADLLKQMAKQKRDDNAGDTISDGDFPEVELIVGDPSKFGKATASKPNTTLKEDSGRYKPKITSWGNRPNPSNTSETDGPHATEPFPEGDFPEVEIIVGDASKFGKTAKSKPTTILKEDSGLHKSKVSSEHESVNNDPLKIAFVKASAYKKAVQSNNPTLKISPNSGRESSENRMKNDGSVLGSTNKSTPLFADLMKQMAKQKRDNNTAYTGETISDGDFPEVELIVGDASKFGKAKASKPNTTMKEDSGRYTPKITSWGNHPSPSNTLETDGSRAMDSFPEGDFTEVDIIVGDASKFVKAAASKPATTLKEDSGSHKSKVPLEPESVDNDPLKLAFAKASAYKKTVQSNNPTLKMFSNSGQESSDNRMKNDGSVLVSANEDTPLFTDLMKQMAKQNIDNNNTGDTIADGDFPEVELIVGDPSKFGKAAVSKPNTMLEDDSGHYKPKITSWGNPPSTINISETLSDSL